MSRRAFVSTIQEAELSERRWGGARKAENADKEVQLTKTTVLEERVL